MELPSWHSRTNLTWRYIFSLTRNRSRRHPCPGANEADFQVFLSFHKSRKPKPHSSAVCQLEQAAAISWGVAEIWVGWGFALPYDDETAFLLTCFRSLVLHLAESMKTRWLCNPHKGYSIPEKRSALCCQQISTRVHRPSLNLKTHEITLSSVWLSTRPTNVWQLLVCELKFDSCNFVALCFCYWTR